MTLALLFYSHAMPMKLLSFLGLALLVPCFGHADTSVTKDVSAATNVVEVPDGWLQLPARELVLDVRQDPLEYGVRRDSGEFISSVLNVLLRANYAVRLSDEYIQGEIQFYRANLSQELPVEMGKAILSCLEKARDSGVLDWDCFKGDFSRQVDQSVAARHLPWMAPPFKARAVSLAGPNGTNLACLRLSLKWTGRGYGGGVQHTRRPGGLMGESVITEGSSKIWAFSAVMQLTKGGQTLFEKSYPREEWQRMYASIYEQPLWKTSQAILQDLASGLRQKPVPMAVTNGKKKALKGSKD